MLPAPVAIVAAGGLLVAEGGAALASRWAPSTLALTHLGALGLLTPVMMGALTQMVPVVAGATVPMRSLSRVAPVALASGLVALVAGFLGAPRALEAAVGLLGLAVGAFLLPVGAALWRAPVRNETVSGMRLAVAALAGLVGFGLVMAWGRATGRAPPLEWVHAHVALGLFGWVGGLVSAVSWHVVPMFYAARPVPQAVARAVRWLLIAGLALSLVSPLLGAGAWTALPAAVAVWGLHPALTLGSLWRRRSRRVDASLGYWLLAMTVAPALLTLITAAWRLPDPRLPVLVGWLAVWGWAGALIHGMLTRILPFLVRLHHIQGPGRAPSTEALLPARRAFAGLALHAAALACGVAAIISGHDGLARLTGVMLAASGVEILHFAASVLRRRPRPSAGGR